MSTLYFNTLLTLVSFCDLIVASNCPYSLAKGKWVYFLFEGIIIGMTTEENKKYDVKDEINAALSAGNGPKIARFALAAVGGAIPYAGGLIGAVGSTWSENEQSNLNKLFNIWLKLQEDEIKEIGKTLVEIMLRVDQTDEKIRIRLESPEYMKLLKKAFRDWSAAESEEKRILVRNLLSNAAATSICSDDVISMFIDWIEAYSELHFKIISTIFNKSGITRAGIWDLMYGQRVREDSAEADLFKLVIQDLSMGHVIRQYRETDYSGNFVKPQRKKVIQRSSTYASFFDDEKEYVLTELGKQFVHYTMNEIVPKLTEGTN